jgi:hypothetical protein
MTIEQTLQRLQVAKVRHVPLADLKTDEALQPRDSRIVPFREKEQVESRSEASIDLLFQVLMASLSVELEPLLATEMDGRLWVVDGHHRLKAYRRAKRETAPVRAMPMERQRAVLVSKLVNCVGRALEMHSEQRRDAAWQYLNAITRQATQPLPEGNRTRHRGLLRVPEGLMKRSLAPLHHPRKRLQTAIMCLTQSSRFRQHAVYFRHPSLDSYLLPTRPSCRSTPGTQVN